MRGHPFLNPIEAAIVRWLVKSPRIGLICIKEHGTTVTWVLKDESDPVSFTGEEEPDISEDEEPDSMKLERLYHLPDAER